MPHIKNPATNESKAKRAYESRLHYKQQILGYVQEDKRVNRFIDLWYDKPLYGKIDNNGDAMYNLPESTLKQLPVEGSMFALDFVTDAYKDMRDFMRDSIEKGNFPSSVGKLKEFTAKSAWRSSERIFGEHLMMLKGLFVDGYLVPHENHIREFVDIIPYYDMFIRNHAKDFPFSYSAFIGSDFCPPQTTGLIIELLDPVHGDDRANVEMFDAFGFQKYVEIAASYGFYVNKNAPWTLVANLSSPRLHKYMSNYDLDDPGKYFDEYCWPAYKLDMKKIKEFLFDAYTTFVEKSPRGKIRRSSSRGGFSTERFFRRNLTLKEFNVKLGTEFWFRVMTKIKAEELQLDIHPTIVDNLIERLNYFLRRDGSMEVSLRHLNLFFKKRNPRINFLLQSATTPAVLPPRRTIVPFTPTPLINSVSSGHSGGGGSSY